MVETAALRTVDMVQYSLKLSKSTPVTCVAGNGLKGSTTIAVGRMLMGRGFVDVRLVLVRGGADHADHHINEGSTQSTEGGSVMKEQLRIFEALGGGKIITLKQATDMSRPGVVIDGILGTGITGPASGRTAEAITCVNSWACPTLSCDIPSGLDPCTGSPPGGGSVCITAKWTLNYGILKAGQVSNAARRHVGELWTTDVGTLNLPSEPSSLQAQRMYEDSPLVRIS